MDYFENSENMTGIKITQECEYYIESLFRGWDIDIDMDNNPIIKTAVNIKTYEKYFGKIPINYVNTDDCDIRITILPINDTTVTIYAVIDYEDMSLYNENIDDYFEINVSTQTAQDIAKLLYQGD